MDRKLQCETARLVRKARAGGVWVTALCALGLMVGVLQARPAAACGGLFCNRQAPVNQTAERILFVDHGDGTMTAAIEIMYQGDADKFAWVLPLGDIANPEQDIRVSSTVALQRLQTATNPLYTLNRSVEGECKPGFPADAGVFFPTFGGGGASGPVSDGAVDPVVVEASGSVGPFDYEFISVVAGTPDPGQAAIDWLDDNGYDLGFDASNNPLSSYLQSGMKLLAVRLTKGNDVGSIRPLMITYVGDSPSIPIKPTAVAAQDDMGVMVFVGSRHRAVPVNYKSLVLNDALIDWFNAAQNYGDVVTAAAGEAGGHGFVTEYAGQSRRLRWTVITQEEMYEWTQFPQRDFTTDTAVVTAALRWKTFDGFSDALKSALSLPSGMDVQDVVNCPRCTLDQDSGGASLDRAAFVDALRKQVMWPMLETENLLQVMPYLTRLYTTMSAPDMTVDPVFGQNADLPDVDNNHTAEMIIECNPDVYQFRAPYRVELPSGLSVRGDDQNVWPLSLDSTDTQGNPVPATLSIGEVGRSGPEKMLLDNAALIQAAIDGTPPPVAGDGDGDGDRGTAGDGDAQGDGDGDAVDNTNGDGAMADGGGDGRSPGLFGCQALPGTGAAGGAQLMLWLLGLWAVRRRRRA